MGGERDRASTEASLLLVRLAPALAVLTRTGRSTELRAAKGAVMPIWSADSKSLMYIDNDGLWLLQSSKSSTSRGSRSPPTSDNWNPYYAQLHWAGSFAWSRSQHLPQPGVLTPM